MIVSFIKYVYVTVETFIFSFIYLVNIQFLLDNQKSTNLGDMYDYLTNTRIFTLIMNKIFL